MKTLQNNKFRDAAVTHIFLTSKTKTMTKTNFLLSLFAAAILVAIFTLPLLVCNIISYGVHFLSSF